MEAGWNTHHNFGYWREQRTSFFHLSISVQKQRESQEIRRKQHLNLSTSRTFWSQAGYSAAKWKERYHRTISAETSVGRRTVLIPAIYLRRMQDAFDRGCWLHPFKRRSQKSIKSALLRSLSQLIHPSHSISGLNSIVLRFWEKYRSLWLRSLDPTHCESSLTLFRVERKHLQSQAPGSQQYNWVLQKHTQ